MLRWMNLKAFGTPNPENDVNLTECRSSSLEYWKKAISLFMPNRLIVWVSGCKEGNPTRSIIEVNNLIKRVKKQEVRKQGRPSKAKRSLTVEEWKTMKNIIVNNKNRDNWLPPSSFK